METYKINISLKLNRNLKSRVVVKNLFDEMVSQNIKSITFDFKDVSFVTRSFMDEFYNKFLNNSSINTGIENLAPHLEQLLDAVKSTQKKSPRLYKKVPDSSVMSFYSIPEVIEYLDKLSFT